MYMDIDYMDQHRDFSYDKTKFGGLPQLISDTKAQNNFHWAVILDPGIEGSNSTTTNPPFMDGYNKGVYIKWDKSVPKDQRKKSGKCSHR